MKNLNPFCYFIIAISLLATSCKKESNENGSAGEEYAKVKFESPVGNKEVTANLNQGFYFNSLGNGSFNINVTYEDESSYYEMKMAMVNVTGVGTYVPADGSTIECETEDDGDFYSINLSGGAINITSFSDQMIEGTFSFSRKSSNTGKTATVSGTFKVKVQSNTPTQGNGTFNLGGQTYSGVCVGNQPSNGGPGKDVTISTSNGEYIVIYNVPTASSGSFNITNVETSIGTQQLYILTNTNSSIYGSVSGSITKKSASSFTLNSVVKNINTGQTVNLTASGSY